MNGFNKPVNTISDERYIAAEDEYIRRIDIAGGSEFSKAVGERQELLLRTTMKGDLDGAFTIAVEEQILA